MGFQSEVFNPDFTSYYSLAAEFCCFQKSFVCQFNMLQLEVNYQFWWFLFFFINEVRDTGNNVFFIFQKWSIWGLLKLIMSSLEKGRNQFWAGKLR